jgi:hypothetical protein
MLNLTQRFFSFYPFKIMAVQELPDHGKYFCKQFLEILDDGELVTCVTIDNAHFHPSG